MRCMRVIPRETTGMARARATDKRFSVCLAQSVVQTGAVEESSVAQSLPPADLIAQAARRISRTGPSWDEYFMATAVTDVHPLELRAAARRLRDRHRRRAHRNRIVAAGYNGFLPGTPHVSRVREGHEQAVVHAEQNAVADAARRGSSVEGCVAYVTHYPCINCAKILAAAGIAEIKYRTDYQNDPIVRTLLDEAGRQDPETLTAMRNSVTEGSRDLSPWIAAAGPSRRCATRISGRPSC